MSESLAECHSRIQIPEFVFTALFSQAHYVSSIPSTLCLDSLSIALLWASLITSSLLYQETIIAWSIILQVIACFNCHVLVDIHTIFVTIGLLEIKNNKKKKMKSHNCQMHPCSLLQSNVSQKKDKNKS